MIYGYARVSTTDQNLDRQIESFKNYSVEKIYTDKMSGKDFNRNEYQKLKANLKNGDLLIIKSIDRLGRNYDMIIDEWRDISLYPEDIISILYGYSTFFTQFEISTICTHLPQEGIT